MKTEDIIHNSISGIVKQGGPAYEITPDGAISCRYITSSGKKCVFGQLIPDNLYFPKMETLPACCVIDDFKGLNEYLDLTGIQKDLIQRLQDSHDYAARELDVEDPDQLSREERIAFFKAFAGQLRLNFENDSDPAIYSLILKEIETFPR